MIRPAPEFRLLASRLLGSEAGGQQEAPDLVDAAETICRKIHEQLASLIGAEGVRALMIRALHLAKDGHPLFQRVEIGSESEAYLKGLRQSAQGLEPTEIRRGIVTFLGNFVWLLATFIGEALALRLVARIWPDVSAEDE